MLSRTFQSDNGIAKSRNPGVLTAEGSEEYDIGASGEVELDALNDKIVTL
jgi:hypothetical protein